MTGYFSGWMLQQRWLAVLIIAIIIALGIAVAPFSRSGNLLSIEPLPIDAIPNIGENLQIVHTAWPGRSPEEMEERITLPLSRTLMGMRGLKSLRSNSTIGSSDIYLIFEEKTGFRESRILIQEKLNTLDPTLIPPEVHPKLGPEATALGQIFWYTLEGVDEEGGVTPAWDLTEMRSIQDFYIKDHLRSVPGVAEVASIGGQIKEYQILLQPDKMRALNIDLEALRKALEANNISEGAHTLEINKAEYFINARGYFRSVEDIENTLVKRIGNQPVLIRDVAEVKIGDAYRRGLLEKNGHEVVGGIVVAQHGANPLKVINALKAKIEEIRPGLPQKELATNQKISLRILPYYDRSQLIRQSIKSLFHTLGLEIGITIFVVLLFLKNFRAALLIASVLPLAVSSTFILMWCFGLEANMASLAGIGIAIGTIVDLSIIQVENLVRKTRNSGKNLIERIRTRLEEINPVILIAGLTTIVSFLPLFALGEAEGKLFHPLAYTKTFALGATIVLVLIILPILVYWINPGKYKTESRIQRMALLTLTALLLAWFWHPLGHQGSFLANLLFVCLILGLFMALFQSVWHYHLQILHFLLKWRAAFLCFLALSFLAAIFIWKNTNRSFLPALNEGSFLLMPTTLPHFGMEENREILFLLDEAISNLPEVDYVVGKMGKTDSALDPAPISMFEILISWKKEFKRDDSGTLIRQWRSHIQSPDDIWNEIIGVARQIPGLTIPPKLQPIETRLLMLQTGMKSPTGIKIKGTDYVGISELSRKLEAWLKEFPGIDPASVFAENLDLKPYIDFSIKRDIANQYGWNKTEVFQHLQAALNGVKAGTFVEEREHYSIRLKYPSQWTDDIEQLNSLPLFKKDARWVNLAEIASLDYRQGPQQIRSEDGFWVSYLFFSPVAGLNDIALARGLQTALQNAVSSGAIILPDNTSFTLDGTFIQEKRASQNMALIITMAILIIGALLYAQFKNLVFVGMIGSGILLAFTGGFLMLACFNQSWLFDVDLLGINPAAIFSIAPQDLNIGVWVGFLVLFGIATDDGVLITSYLRQLNPKDQKMKGEALLSLISKALSRRIRPALMTTSTTAVAMLPILTGAGDGNAFLLSMAIPVLGGALFQMINVFTIPVFYSIWLEHKNN